MIAAIWCLTGIVVGIAHVWSLSHSARNARSVSAGGGLRLLLVGGLLVLAAVNGNLLPAALGWGLSFPIAAAAQYWRKWT